MKRNPWVLEQVIYDKDGKPSPWGLGDWHQFGRYASRERAEQALHDIKRKADFWQRYHDISYRIVEKP